ncbi:uncharacterized protein LOC111640183 [Centruroides sculpturatus]|uniref:uncharacterized protein LOC111640183 n=1 Tax=Centruroides sculpturatus TaxID=218467 RepID=UPI000C6D7575|nr:uncharacterized protein LOC111640183 [Centruroides sculpturatus]
MKSEIYRRTFVLLLYCLIEGSMAADVAYRGNENEDRCNKTVDIYQAVSSPPVTEANRGKALHCSYRVRVRPARDDWVVFVRFTKLRIGRPTEDRQQCIGGYVQIIDGYRESNHSNRANPGFYCGDIDSPKTFISETPHVKIVFHVDKYDYDTYLQFDANVEQQREVHARYGQYPQLYPNRRGAPIYGTYCDRVFHDCSPGRCFVQSPGFPGIYPRGLHCRYRLSVRHSLVGLDLTTFDVDGLRCDNLLMCFPRPISRQAEDCPFDYVRVYDGPTEDSPVIVTLCGRGRLKSNIIASGSEMLVEFITSPAGPLLNTGFHFKADSIYDTGDTESLQLRNSSCSIERHLRGYKESDFSNLRSWYPGNTTCFYRFVASEEEVIRLEFLWFRVERVTLCEESIKLYDSYEPDGMKIISKLCDMNKPRAVYETTGPVMFVEFFSHAGSLDGSSLSYGFQVKTVNVMPQDNHISQSACNKIYDVAREDIGSFSLSLQDLNFTLGNQPIVCNYTFDASSLPHGRINITLLSPLSKMVVNCHECLGDPLLMEVYAGVLDDPPYCLCQSNRQRVHHITSLGSKVLLSLHLTPEVKGMKIKTYLQGNYTHFSDYRCGTEIRPLDLQGVIQFPPSNVYPTKAMYCRWRVPIFPRMDVSFQLEHFHGQNNCTFDYIIVNQIILCQTLSSTDETFILEKEEIRKSDVTVEYRTSESSEGNFTLWWTQLKVLPTPSSSDSLVSLGKDCEFLCASTMTCIRKELVCNGVQNCPKQSSGHRNRLYAADEDPTICLPQQDSFRLYWWIIGFALGVCGCVLLCLVFSLCRRCQSRRQRF